MFRDTDFFWTMRWTRVDAIAIFVLAVGTMAVTQGRWSWFLMLFLVPDLSMTGYLFGRRAGAVVYNTVHMYAWPLAMCTVGTFNPIVGPRQFVVTAGFSAVDERSASEYRQPLRSTHTCLCAAPVRQMLDPLRYGARNLLRDRRRTGSSASRRRTGA